MSAANYALAEPLIWNLEGGYANNPKDPGGATYHGITLRALCDYRDRNCTIADLKALTPAEGLVFYKCYWNAVSGDALPPGVDLIIFDAAVNCGRGRAGTFLQKALSVIPVDGQIGPQTLRALAGVNDIVGLVERIQTVRAAYYRSLSAFSYFGAGWTNRLNTVAATSTAWARKAA